MSGDLKQIEIQAPGVHTGLRKALYTEKWKGCMKSHIRKLLINFFVPLDLKMKVGQIVNRVPHFKKEKALKFPNLPLAAILEV